MEQRIPAEVFSPGEYIKDEMEARGWSQDDLASILDRPNGTINKLLNGKTSVSVETATGLAAAFGTSPEVWMNLENAYRLWLHSKKEVSVKKDDTGVIAKRAALYAIAPVKDMTKRQWIAEPRDVNDLERKLKVFYGTDDLDHIPSLSMAAKKTATDMTMYTASNPAQKAWGHRVKTLAKSVSAAKYNEQVFQRELPNLRRLLARDVDVARVPQVLAELGVRFVLVEHLPKSYMDGAALWLDENSPVVALTTRFDRIDNFWFCLFHELAHIKFHHCESIDERMAGPNSVPTDQKPPAEQEADREAVKLLVPQDELKDFVMRTAPLFYPGKVNQFANRIKVHPGIIVGQLQRNKDITYAQCRTHLKPVRNIILTTAMSDGWGFAPELT